MTPEKLITNDMIDRDAVRVRLRRELYRVACAVWWGVYTIEDASRELRGQAFLMAERMKINPDLIDAAVPQWLDQELSRHETEHTDSLEAMTQAAFVAIREGNTQAHVRRAVAQCAADRPIPPPRHLLTVAMEAAAQQQRRAEYWWKKREPIE